MMNGMDDSDKRRAIATRWCSSRGSKWELREELGKGGTATVFEISTPDGPRSLKIYDSRFSSGEKGEIELKRIQKQLDLKDHDCPSLVQVYDGGRFEDRLYLLMGRAPGQELEKVLNVVPRDQVRYIVDQVARAAIYLNKKDRCHRDIKAANVFISDNFRTVTLLDTSVLRDVIDPVGLGTDHNDQLPIVATARYSPPEYLFRLVDASPELWHALNVYQLGALLHDLIMKEPMFQSEYERSSENRYRFAWIVATVTPTVTATDIDQDLVFLARRALDKDWQRRSTLQLEDFLGDAHIQQSHALALLGLEDPNRTAITSSDDATATLKRISVVAKRLEWATAELLKNLGALNEHTTQPGPNDHSKILIFRWLTHPANRELVAQAISLEISIAYRVRWEGKPLFMCVSTYQHAHR